MRNRRKKVGLALGSGSARGWAHIGVIEALEEAEIPIDYIAGSSIGAFVGAFYAIDEFDYLRQFANALDWREVISFFDVRFPSKGFLDGSKINDLITQQIKNQNIEDTKIPFITVATDLDTGKEIRFTSGNIVEAVRASISIPGVFTPVKSNNSYLVDGGLVNPIPVDVVRDMGADIVIAVDLNRDLIEKKKERRQIRKLGSKDVLEDTVSDDVPAIQKLKNRYKLIGGSVTQKLNEWMPGRDAPNIFEVIANSLNIMEIRIAQNNLKIHKPDFLIEPHVGNLGLFDFDRAEEAIKKGKLETAKYISDIKKIL